MSATKGPDTAKSAAWPTDTFVGDEKDIFFNDEGIQVIHIPAAHTDGDSIVFFRKSDVISTGDLFTTTMYPSSIWIGEAAFRALSPDCRRSWT